MHEALHCAGEHRVAPFRFGVLHASFSVPSRFGDPRIWERKGAMEFSAPYLEDNAGGGLSAANPVPADTSAVLEAVTVPGQTWCATGAARPPPSVAWADLNIPKSDA